MTGPAMLGVDPGGRYTGLCLVDADGVVVDAATIVREPAGLSRTAWVQRVMDCVDRFTDRHAGEYGVAVEDAHPPRRYVSGKPATVLQDPEYLMDTAFVAGAVVGLHPGAYLVPPGGNGKRAGVEYPAVLRGKRPAAFTRFGVKAPSRDHETAAFDCARRAQNGEGVR